MIFPRNNAKSLERLEMFNLGVGRNEKIGGIGENSSGYGSGVYERTQNNEYAILPVGQTGAGQRSLLTFHLISIEL